MPSFCDTISCTEKRGHTMKTPVMLMILDGFGLAPAGPSNAISTAKTPNLDRLFAECPNARLNASGTAVGLPKGQMGN